MNAVRSLVVYDSLFGNTRSLAAAVAARLRPKGPVRTCRMGEVTVDDVARADLLASDWAGTLVARSTLDRAS